MMCVIWYVLYIMIWYDMICDDITNGSSVQQPKTLDIICTKSVRGGHCPLFEKMAEGLEKWASCENRDISSVGTLSPICKKRKDHHMSKRKENKHIWYDMICLDHMKGRPKSKVVHLPGYAESLITISDHYYCVMIWYDICMWVWLLKAAVRHFCI